MIYDPHRHVCTAGNEGSLQYQPRQHGNPAGNVDPHRHGSCTADIDQPLRDALPGLPVLTTGNMDPHRHIPCTAA
eukprot:11119658-Prorocentrum_lima.AAC.1